MGTTQRIGNGVKNEPNWGNLSSSITSVSKAIEELIKLDSNDESSSDIPVDNQILDDQIILNKKYKKIVKRRDDHIKSSLRRLVIIGGGASKISKGESKKIGRAGIKTSSKLSSFFYNVSNHGLGNTLNQLGFSFNDNTTTQDVIDFLTNYCSESNVGMDDIAAKSALCEVLKELDNNSDHNINNFEDLMIKVIDQNLLSNMLCDFFGKYIYEYLWERLEEKLRQSKGFEIAKNTFDSIKKEIRGRVELLNSNRSLSSIDWADEEGKIEIENIFEAILTIEG